MKCNNCFAFTSFTRNLMLFGLLLYALNSHSQDCGCSVYEVENNAVASCNQVIGELYMVSSVSELLYAIGLVNDQGGNGTILMEDGDYDFSSNGSFPFITGSNVVLRSQSGNRDAVVIRGAGNLPNSSYEHGILIAGDNVTIADLTIKEVGNHGIQVSGHNLLVHNVKIQDTYEQMIKGSTTADRIDFGVVQCSLFEYTAGIGPNWYIGGLDIHKGNGWKVHDNVFKDISSPHTAVAEHAVHFWIECSDNIVERNVIYNCDRGIGFGLGTNGNQNQGGIIRNNIIYNNGATEYHDVGIGLESSPGTKVYNNSIHVEYFNAIEYRFESTTGVEIYNNLCNQAISSRNGASGTLGTNISDAQSEWFVDVASGDLHLAWGVEEVIDQGTELPSFVMNDIDKELRPLNDKTDIGADELLLTSISEIEDAFEILSDLMNNTFILKGALQNYSFDIFNANGIKVHSFIANGNTKSINLSHLPSAVYFLVASNNADGSLNTKKIIVY